MSEDRAPEPFENAEAAAEAVYRRVGSDVVLAIPLGVGKPNPIVNALYRAAAERPGRTLTIATALTLRPPAWSSELERRLVEPISQRLFGGYPPLEYAEAQRNGTLPENVRIVEFFFAPGSKMTEPDAQQNYVSTNYTQAARDLARLGVNVIAQLFAIEEVDGRPMLSMGSNGDLTTDLLRQLEAFGRRPLLIGQISRHMPFMYGDAVLDPSRLDGVLDRRDLDFPLVGPPNEPVSLAAHALGAIAAALVRDGGTLQLGIGAVADAITSSLLLRQRRPPSFRQLVSIVVGDEDRAARVFEIGGGEPFTEGIYAETEMFVPGYLELYRGDVLRRSVRAPEASGEEVEAVLRAGFFLGPRAFYEALIALEPEARREFRMMSISFTNALGTDPRAAAARRRHARFLNSGLFASILGDVASETLGDGRVVGGVGGQFDFASMAHELPEGRSVLLIRSTHGSGDEARSNIRAAISHATIPRHLRDLVVTEYGVADIRGKTDREVIEAMIELADARFVDELASSARRAEKLPASYRVSDRVRARNHPQRLERELAPLREAGHLPELPFGSDLTRVEIALERALTGFAKAPWASKAAHLVKNLRTILRPPEAARPYLDRLGLSSPRSPAERRMQALVLAALAANKDLHPVPGARDRALGNG